MFSVGLGSYLHNDTVFITSQATSDIDVIPILISPEFLGLIDLHLSFYSDRKRTLPAKGSPLKTSHA